MYLRKSSESDEKQKMSIPAQKKFCKTKAKDLGIKPEKIIEESHSAKVSFTRPEFVDMIHGIRNNEFNAILCWHVDRLSRNAGDLGTLVDLMDEGKLQMIITNTQVFRNTPNEKFLLMILCSQSKLENDNRGTNAKRGMLASVENGGYPTRVPFGYQREYIGKKTKIIVNEYEVAHVKKMFHLATKMHSIREISQIIYKKYEVQYQFSRIQNILSNPFYTGKFEYPRGSGNRYKGNYKAIITEKTYQKVRKIMAGKQVPKAKWGSRRSVFSGVLRCKICNSKMTGRVLNKAKKSYFYYQCCNNKHSCKASMRREEYVANSVIEQLATMRISDFCKADYELARNIISEVQGKNTVIFTLEKFLRIQYRADKDRFKKYIKGSIFEI